MGVTIQVNRKIRLGAEKQTRHIPKPRRYLPKLELGTLKMAGSGGIPIGMWEHSWAIGLFFLSVSLGRTGQKTLYGRLIQFNIWIIAYLNKIILTNFLSLLGLKILDNLRLLLLQTV